MRPTEIEETRSFLMDALFALAFVAASLEARKQDARTEQERNRLQIKLNDLTLEAARIDATLDALDNGSSRLLPPGPDRVATMANLLVQAQGLNNMQAQADLLLATAQIVINTAAEVRAA